MASSSGYRLSLEAVQKAVEIIDPVFLNSPQFECEPLSELLGVNLVVKVETVNPVRSFKGRGAEVLVGGLARAEPLICASAGNFSQAMAYACRQRGIDLTVYVSKNANEYKVERMRAFGANIKVYGEDFDAAKDAAREEAHTSKVRFVEDSLDIETLVGTGTIALELLKLPKKLDVLLVALGNGALFNGIARVIKAFSPTTRMVAVGATGASAMIESVLSDKVVVHEKVNTIADGIAIRVPVPQSLEDMRRLVDDTILVEDSSIIKAMQLIHSRLGLVVEPSGAVGIAALLENPTAYKSKAVGTVLCGGNLTASQVLKWLLVISRYNTIVRKR